MCGYCIREQYAAKKVDKESIALSQSKRTVLLKGHPTSEASLSGVEGNDAIRSSEAASK